MRHTYLTISLALLCSCTAWGQNRTAKQQGNYPPVIKGASVETYKTAGETKLKMWIFKPADHKPTDKRSAAVFFFGGGWRSGSPKQFEQHCRYLAKRGMVAMTADYRVSSRHNTKAKTCVEDGKSAIRWIRQNAKRLGVDANRIVAGGGSAGGHVAAATGVVSGFEVGETKVSSQPNAMALFNPALVLASTPEFQLDKKLSSSLESRLGVSPEKLSPWHNVQARQPPTIIFHGKADKTVPYKSAEMFASKMKKVGNRCELKGYADQGHGFFNYRGDKVMFNRTIQELDGFLVSLGYLSKK